MKTIAIGDIHGRSNWKLILHREDPDRVIFIGDYFDSYEFSLIEQLHNFKEIINWKLENQDTDVIMLIGNHDHHYFPEVGYTGTSGHQGEPAAIQIGHILTENRKHLQMAYGMKDGDNQFLFSHAGVSPQWLWDNGWDGFQPVSEFVNDMWKHKPLHFRFYGTEPTGDNTWQTPIWIRPRSLMQAGEHMKKAMIQVVGHTAQKQIDIKGKSTGGRYYFIDTLGTSGEYLVIQNGTVTANKI